MNMGISVSRVLSIYAGTHGCLNILSLSEIAAWEQGFLEFIHAKKQPLWEKITETRQLDDAAEREIDAAIAEFQKQYNGATSKATVAI